MRLDALRVKAVGRFASPIAVENIAPGLNSLPAPNEAGKSTLLAALRAAFFIRYTSKAADICGLRTHSPNGETGAPLIEVDFSVQGRRYRIRKRFLSGSASGHAELRDLDNAEVMARGADAEERLAAVLGGEDALEKLRLCWLAQQTTLRRVALSGAPHDTLQRVLADSVKQVVGAEGGHALRRRVAKELDELVTSGRRSPRGPYKAALENLASIENELAQLRQAREQASEILDGLEELHAEAVALSDPERVAQLHKDMQCAEEKVLEARQARAKVDAAREELVRAQLEENAASLAFSQMQAMVLDVEKLRKNVRQTRARRVALEGQKLELTSRLASAKSKRDRLRTQRSVLRRRIEIRDLDERREHLKGLLDDLSGRLHSARSARRELDRLERKIAGIEVTPDLVSAINRESAAISAIEMRIEQMSPTVAIALGPKAKRQVRLGGKSITASIKATVHEELQISVGEIADITVRPGAGDDQAQNEADRMAHEQTLAQLLKEAGADTPEDARKAFQELRALEQGREAARIKLKASAPEGISSLQEDIDHRHEQLTQLEGAIATARAALAEAGLEDALEDALEAGTPEGSRQDLARDLAGLEEALEQCEREDGAARGDLSGLREALERAAAEVEFQEARIAELEAGLPPEGERGARLQELEDQAKACAGRLREKVRSLEVWQDSASSDEQLAALEAALAAKRHALEERQGKLARLRRDIRDGEIRLDQSRRDGIGERLADLEGQRERAAARVGSIERELEGLELLREALERSASEIRDQLTAPLIARMEKPLRKLFPKGRLIFAKDICVDRIERGGMAEPVAQLSDGTREQIAVLTYLGFADLFASGGFPVPLILDDPLAYSDEGRLAKFAGIFKAAAKRHQIIVLTSREGLAGRLKGNSLAIRPLSSEDFV